jgi:hypothetical protein
MSNDENDQDLTIDPTQEELAAFTPAELKRYRAAFQARHSVRLADAKTQLNALYADPDVQSVLVVFEHPAHGLTLVHLGMVTADLALAKDLILDEVLRQLRPAAPSSIQADTESLRQMLGAASFAARVSEERGEIADALPPGGSIVDSHGKTIVGPTDV